MAILTDAEIHQLLSQRKYFPENPRVRPRPKAHAQHEESELSLTTDSQLVFKVRIRKHRFNALKFSIILLYRDQENKTWLRLLRCNGKHEHSNDLEGERFYAFHVHKATQRYMEAGYREDLYAYEAPYSSFDGALNYFFEIANCRRAGENPTLFGGTE